MSVDYLVLETLSEQWKWQWWYCLSAKEIIGESILVYPLIWSDVQECTGLNEYKWWKLLLPLFTVFKTNGPFQNSPKEWNWLRWDGYLRVVWGIEHPMPTVLLSRAQTGIVLRSLWRNWTLHISCIGCNCQLPWSSSFTFFNHHLTSPNTYLTRPPDPTPQVRRPCFNKNSSNHFVRSCWELLEKQKKH